MVKGLLSVVVICLLSSPAFAQRGCCSHHGGVASCGSDGYEQCNDGSESPSCTCDNNARPEEGTAKKGEEDILFTPNRTVNQYLDPVAASYVKNVA